MFLIVKKSLKGFGKTYGSRQLHLHEYQSKELMQKYGLCVQRFKVIQSKNEVESLPEFEEYVLKAQIHAGGRGKGTFSSGLKSGVHITKK
jgi:succinyl-CoA synthetase beta subunit